MRDIVFHVLWLCLCGTAVVAADFYMAPAGNDRHDGSKERPFASLERAMRAVRELKKEGKTSIRVLLRGGTYRLNKTVVFGLEDSASGGGRITYAAYPGETPVLTSAFPVGGWQRVDGALPGLPEAARGRIWVADVPDGFGRFHTLYDGDKSLPRARGKGFRPIAGHTRPWKLEHKFQLPFPPGAMKNWPNPEDVDVLILPTFPWTFNILPLESVDERKLGIRSLDLSQAGPREAARAAAVSTIGGRVTR